MLDSYDKVFSEKSFLFCQSQYQKVESGVSQKDNAFPGRNFCKEAVPLIRAAATVTVYVSGHSYKAYESRCSKNAFTYIKRLRNFGSAYVMYQLSCCGPIDL